MAVARSTVWVANDILTALDLNVEFDNILGNGNAVGWPRDGSALTDMDGETLYLDGDADTTLRSSVDDVIDIAIAGTDTYQLTATHMTINGQRVLTTSDRAEYRNMLARIGMMEARISAAGEDAFTVSQLNNF